MMNGDERRYGLDHGFGHARAFLVSPARTRYRSNSLPGFQKHPDVTYSPLGLAVSMIKAGNTMTAVPGS
jgi:hypothetical protein